MFHPNHTLYIKALYKNILAEGSLFFDDRARCYIKNRVRKTFQEYKTCTDIERVKYKIKEARKRLHRIEQANRGNQRSALKILEETYGRSGKTRHALLHPFLNCHQPVDMPSPEPFVAHVPRTAPPPTLCLPLRSLITQHLGKKVEPELPIPAYKPLHPSRTANLLWRYRSMLLDRVQVPLPFEILCEIEIKAGASIGHPLYSGTLVTGGPRWHEFYIQRQSMMHLDPTITMVPQSKLVRKVKLMDSPYATTKPSLLECIGQDTDDDDDRPLYQYSDRQKRRIYRRLLTHIPLMDIISPLELWDQQSKSYKISKSHWVPQGVTQLLEDIPSEQVIEITLSSSTKKKIRRS